MRHRVRTLVSAVFFVVVVLSFVVPRAEAQSPRSQTNPTATPDVQPATTNPDVQPASAWPPIKPFSVKAVRYDLHHDTYTPLQRTTAISANSTLVPSAPLTNTAMPTPTLVFDGAATNPMDVFGAIGANHYLQMAGGKLSVWSKNGTLLVDPTPPTQLWENFGSCDDISYYPTIQYDTLANRWVIQSIGRTYGYESRFDLCYAVSATSDPLGAWYRYAFLADQDINHDYTGVSSSIWSSHYATIYNQYDPDTDDNLPYVNKPDVNYGGNSGIDVFIYDRAAMLRGLPARQVLLNDPDSFQQLKPVTTDTQVDSDNDGLFLGRGYVWSLDLDWDDPLAATITADLSAPLDDLAVYDSDCTGFPFQNLPCIPVKDRSPGLVPNGSIRPALQYRRFATYESITLAGVNLGSTPHPIQWAELRNTGDGWFVYQYGAYQPDQQTRWAPAVAQDHAGNLALGYSASSSSIYPTIRLAGRLATDPINQLPLAERDIVQSGAPTSFELWLNHTVITLDPVDQCTYWYTNAYTAEGIARTLIAAFNYPSCLPVRTNTLTGRVTDQANGQPVADAMIRIGSYSAFSDATGMYTATLLPTQSYTVTAEHIGYTPSTPTQVVIDPVTPTSLDVALAKSPVTSLSGVVRDSVTGLPLHAALLIQTGAVSLTVESDPTTGAYSTTLLAGEQLIVDIRSLEVGYIAQKHTFAVQAGNNQRDFSLSVDRYACNAAGYQRFVAIDEHFNNSVIPAGWSGDSWIVVNEHAEAEDKSPLTSPEFDLSDFNQPYLEFTTNDWISVGYFSPIYGVYVSDDGGATWSYFWTTRQRHQGINGRVRLDLSKFKDKTKVKIGFSGRYYSDTPSWSIDDVLVADANCRPVAGWLEGHVYSSATNQPLGGMRIQQASDPSNVIFSKTDNYSDTAMFGSYRFYLPLGTTTVLVDDPRYLYQPISYTVTITQPGTLQHDFWLSLAPIAVIAPNISRNLMQNEVITDTVALVNQTTSTQQLSLAVAPISGTVNADWLRIPSSITLAPSSTEPLDLTLDAHGLAVGTYYAQISFSGAGENTPKPILVTIHVRKLQILVTGRTYVKGIAFEGFTIKQLDNPQNVVFSRYEYKDGQYHQGVYKIYIPGGTTTLVASRSGFETITQTFTISEPTTIVHDFNMQPIPLVPNPTAIEYTLTQGTSVTLPLSMTNNGPINVYTSIYAYIPYGFHWLQTPANITTLAQSTSTISLTLDSQNLAIGTYRTTIYLTGMFAADIAVPVTLHVQDEPTFVQGHVYSAATNQPSDGIRIQQLDNPNNTVFSQTKVQSGTLDPGHYAITLPSTTTSVLVSDPLRRYHPITHTFDFTDELTATYDFKLLPQSIVVSSPIISRTIIQNTVITPNLTLSNPTMISQSLSLAVTPISGTVNADWLHIPSSITLAPSSTIPLNFTLDAYGLAVGSYHAQISLSGAGENTPQPVLVTIHVREPDPVPPTYTIFIPYIER